MASWFELEGTDLERLLEVLASSDVTFLKLRRGDVEFVISRDIPSRDPGEPTETETPERGDPAQPAVAAGSGRTVPPRQQDDGAADPGPGTPSLVPVTAPMSGFFHHTPEPGAAPFVAVGTPVTEESTVGLIEAMKVFTAVQAGVAGVVAEVLAEAGALVEEGQALLSVHPDGVAGEGGTR